MSKTTKIIVGIIIVVIIIGGIWYGLTRKPAGKEVIKIGAILPLTGKAAQYGEEIKRGIELAKENIKDVSFEIIYGDSKYETKEGVSIYQKLKTEDARLMIVSASTIVVALSPLANQDKIILMGTTASTPDYTSPNDFTFRVTTRAEVEDKELARWALDKGYKKIALMYVNNDWGLGHYNSIKPEIEKLGGEITSAESFMAETNDFRTNLAKIKAGAPEAVFLLVEAKTAGIILKQARELGLTSQFFGAKTLQSADLIPVAGKAAEGVVYTYPFDPFSQKSLIKEFVKRYQEKYGDLPTSFVAEGYDSTNLILNALRDCKKLDTSCMKDSLLKTKNYPGILGNLTFDENGDVYYPYFLKTIKNGQFVPYNE